MSANKWVYVRETLKEILNSNSFNCFVDLEWHFGCALTCLHFHRGKRDLNDLQHHGSRCFVPRSLSGTGTLLRRSPLLINRCNRASVFLKHNSVIVFNAWLSFWRTHAVFTNVHTSPSSSKHSQPIPVYDQLSYSNLSFPQTSSIFLHKNQVSENKVSQKNVTYIFMDLWKTGAEVENRCQISTYITSDFHWFGAGWTLGKITVK